MQLTTDPAAGRFQTVPDSLRDLPALRRETGGDASVDVTVDREVRLHVAGTAPAGFAKGALSIDGQPVSSRSFPAG